MTRILSILAALAVLSLPIIAIAQAPVPEPVPVPAVTPIPAWPLPAPEAAGGWKAVGLMLLAGAITTFGTAGLRAGMRTVGQELPPVAMPAVTIGVTGSSRAASVASLSASSNRFEASKTL